MRPRRREGDRDGDDFTGSRNGHIRWIVALVSFGIIVSLGAFASSERTRLDDTETLARKNDKRLEVLTTSVNLRLGTIEHHVKDIAEALKDERR